MILRRTGTSALHASKACYDEHNDIEHDVAGLHGGMNGIIMGRSVNAGEKLLRKLLCGPCMLLTCRSGRPVTIAGVSTGA